MVKISFVTITARTDYPYIGRPDLNIFEPTLESFKFQTMNDFEWIIVDQLYETRKSYFKNSDLPFTIKHVPAHPNVWHDVGLCGVSTQFNTGIVHANGELLFFSAEGYMYMPSFCDRLWNHYKEGYIPLAWYFYDNSFVPPHMKVSSQDWITAFPENSKQPPVSYNICGYTGENIVTEHRPLVVFKNNSATVSAALWEWWFGCSSAPLDAMLKINGFDQRFDGDRMLLDCDVGSRLEMAGYNKFALFRDLFIIRPRPHDEWNATLPKDGVTIKCNLPLLWWSRSRQRYRANEYEYTDEDIKWIKEEYCGRRCEIRELCRTQHPWQYPFEHKAGYGFKSEKRWFDFWRAHQGIRDLTDERKKGCRP